MAQAISCVCSYPRCPPSHPPGCMPPCNVAWETPELEAVLSIVAGVFGIWAVLFKNTRAAKVYMLTWPAKILAMVWAALALHSLYATYDVEEGPVGIAYLVTLFCLLYYFKVRAIVPARRACGIYMAYR